MLKPKFKNLSEMLNEYRHLMVDIGTVPPSTKQEKKPVVAESKVETKAAPLAERAPLSQYSSSKRALDSFRVLAGMEEREIMPWDPGLSGTTRYDNGVLAEANLTEDKK